MCPNLFSEEAPCGSILVNDHLLQATTKSLHFEWLLTGGSTVFHFYYFRQRNYEKEDKAVCLLLHLGVISFSLVLLIRCLRWFCGHVPSSLYTHHRVFTQQKNRLYNTNWKRTSKYIENSNIFVSEPSWEERLWRPLNDESFFILLKH